MARQYQIRTLITQLPDSSEPATQVVLPILLLKCPFCPSCGRYGINVRGCADITKLKYTSRSLIFVGISLQEAACTFQKEYWQLAQLCPCLSQAAAPAPS